MTIFKLGSKISLKDKGKNSEYHFNDYFLIDKELTIIGEDSNHFIFTIDRHPFYDRFTRYMSQALKNNRWSLIPYLEKHINNKYIICHKKDMHLYKIISEGGIKCRKI